MVLCGLGKFDARNDSHVTSIHVGSMRNEIPNNTITKLQKGEVNFFLDLIPFLVFALEKLLFHDFASTQKRCLPFTAPKMSEEAFRAARAHCAPVTNVDVCPRLNKLVHACDKSIEATSLICFEIKPDVQEFSNWYGFSAHIFGRGKSLNNMVQWSFSNSVMKIRVVAAK